MRLLKWRRASRVAVCGMSAAAIAMAAPPDEGRDSATDSPARSQATSASRPAKADPKGVGHVELERLNRQTGAQEAPKEKVPPAPGADGPAGEAKDATAPAKAEVVNAFASTSWYVPPPPPKPEPPPKPTAPPLPFTFLGRYVGGAPAGVVVMLTKGDRLYTVSEGDVIDDTYRVERITERTVELIYLPLKEKQLLQTGGA